MKPSYWLIAACAVALPAAVACSSDPSTLGMPGDGTYSNGNHPGGPAPNTTSTTPSTTGTTPSTTPTGATTAPGGVQPPPGVPTADAKTFFIQQVYPSLQATCGGCHDGAGANGAPGYLGTDGASAYTASEGRGYISPNSMLLKKGQHEGPALTSAQVALVNQWLQMEATARGPGQLPDNLLAKLGSCVDPTLFNNIGLKTLYTTRRTNENPNRCTGCDNVSCQTCHSTGEEGMHHNFGNLGTQTLAALQKNGTSPEGAYLIAKYVTTNGTQLVPSTALMDKATATQAGPAYSHPMFTLTPAMQTAIQAFANDIITKYNNKTCGQ